MGILYIFVMHFGVLNVVVGMFVNTAAEVASKDRESFVKHELTVQEQYRRKIKTFFREADLSGSGRLSWEDLSLYLESDKAKAYFNGMDLDVSQANVLFTLLDTDSSNSICIDE